MSERTGRTAATTSDQARRRRLAAGLVLIVVLGIVAVAIYKPWRPLRYGRATPPPVPTETLEPALTKLLDERTATVAGAPYSAEAWGQLGIAYDVHDMPQEAIACYGRAHRLDPDEFRWIYFLGLTSLPSDHSAAHAHLLAARELRPDYAPLELHLGQGFFDAGDLDRAATHFERGAALDPALVRPHVGLARIALARARPGEALKHLEAALERGPKGGEVYFLLAETHRRLGNDAEAREFAARAGDRAAFEEFSDRVRMESQWEVGVTMFWRATRSRAYLESGMTDRAVGEWIAVLDEDPGSDRAWVELGDIYARIGDVARANEAYGRALAIDPALHTVRYQLGLLLFRSGRREPGLTLVRESCDALPDRADLRSNLGRLLAQNGRNAEAAEAFRAAGRQFAATARFDPARRAFERAVELIADDAAATTDLAWLLATCPDAEYRDAGRAQRLIEAFVKKETATPRMYDALGAAYAAQGDFAAAIRAAETALAESNDLPQVDRAALETRLAGYREGRVFIDSV